MGTNDFIHQLIDLGATPFAPNWIVDVRAIARGHVLQGCCVPEGGQA
jgi:hypothetical protein